MQKREDISRHFGPITGAALQATTVDAWTALVAPGDVFRNPREVLSHPMLSRGQKRAILASWASDAHAVDSCPMLRCLPGGKAEVVPVDTVLTALAELDAGNDTRLGTRRIAKPPAQRRSRPFSQIRQTFRPRHRDEDDDPPPCPAAAMPRPRPPTPATEAAPVFA